jgi:uncharacterized protein
LIRVVIDTNLYVSALINANSRRRLDLILENPRFEIVADQTLFDELLTVISRPKFARLVTPAQIDDFLMLLQERSLVIKTVSIVRHSPDPKDDFLLALCQDSSSDYLITGNKLDLLDLKKFGEAQIVSLTEFLNIHNLQI